MKPTDEELMAYADGELAGTDAVRVAAAIAADPALTARVAAHCRLRGRLSHAYAPVLAQPVPLRVQAAAVRLARAAAGRPAAIPSGPWRGSQWLAMAASLLIGLLLARGLPPGDAESGIVSRDGELIAAGVLAHALDGQISGVKFGGVDVRMSFLDADGHACRVFVTGGDAALAGLACRHGKGWRLPVLVQAPASAGQDMRQAASPLPPGLLEAVDARMDGEPLNAVAEDAAIRAGWGPAW